MAEIYTIKTLEQFFEAMKSYLIGESSTLTNFNEGTRLRTMLNAISFVLSTESLDYYQSLKRAIPVAIFIGFDF